MKKKILSAILAVTMIISMTACSDLEPAGTAATTGAQAQESGTASADTTSAETTDPDEFIVGFIFDSYVDDAGWGYEHNRGRLAVEDAGIKTIYKENVPTTQDSEKVMQDFINSLICSCVYL